VIATLLTVAVVKLQGLSGPLVVYEPILVALDYAIFINLILAFFNLIPIPPLDGSHVLAHMLPQEMAMRFRHFGQYGILALMAIMYFVPGAFSVVLWPVLFLRGLADWFVRLWI
jgi:Zn-dependent protease